MSSKRTWMSLSRIFLGVGALAGIVQDLFIGLSSGIPYVWMLFAALLVLSVVARFVPPISKLAKSLFQDAWFAPICLFLVLTTIGTTLVGYYSRQAWVASSGPSGEGDGVIISGSEEILRKLGLMDAKLTDMNKKIDVVDRNTSSMAATELDVLRYMSLLPNLDNAPDVEQTLRMYWERGGVGPNYSLSHGETPGYAATFFQPGFITPFWVNVVANDAVSIKGMRTYIQFYQDHGLVELQDYRTPIRSAPAADRSNSFDDDCRTALSYSSFAEHMSCLAFGFKRWARPVDKVGGMTPLIVAVNNHSNEKIPVLLELGADPEVTDAAGYLPIDYALLSGNTEAVKILMEAGARISQDTISMMAFAALKQIIISPDYFTYGPASYAQFMKPLDDEHAPIFIDALEYSRQRIESTLLDGSQEATRLGIYGFEGREMLESLDRLRRLFLKE
ncbi:MAG: ankyrin repeat domain-containing protein [Alloalcanivorax venustensis]|jgi:ankyrin repeat protein|uniref:ankyrin repeat domain-containing protein n=1 Tax=Alloalcanivorax venustensis TaxID=172371 RepID=UPI003002A66E